MPDRRQRTVLFFPDRGTDFFLSVSLPGSFVFENFCTDDASTGADGQPDDLTEVSLYVELLSFRRNFRPTSAISCFATMKAPSCVRLTLEQTGEKINII